MALEILILYQDFVTGVRAHRLLNAVQSELPAEMQFSETLVRFDLLPSLKNSLPLNEIIQMFIVSAHHWQAVPFTVRQLVSDWHKARATGPWAFAMLLDRPETSRLVMTRSSQADQLSTGWIESRLNQFAADRTSKRL